MLRIVRVVSLVLVCLVCASAVTSLWKFSFDLVAVPCQGGQLRCGGSWTPPNGVEFELWETTLTEVWKRVRLRLSFRLFMPLLMCKSNGICSKIFLFLFVPRRLSIVTALCPPCVLFGHTSKPCPPYVRHLCLLCVCPPCVRLVSSCPPCALPLDFVRS